MEKKKTASKIGIGYAVGLLSVEEPTDQKKNGYTVWRCRCRCGGEILLDTRALQRRTIQDCGCITKTKPGQRNLKDMRFGLLVCREPTERRNNSGSVIWKCDCDCGNVCYVPASELVTENTKSCGCLSHPPLKRLIGRKFDRLEVIEYAGKRNGMHRWKCRCRCGNETIVGQTLLESRKTKSCGCLRDSVILDNLKLAEGTSVAILESKKKLARNNKSGYTGVYQRKDTGKWTSQITFKNKTYSLGCFDDKEKAIAARLKGEEMHDDFIRWYYEEHPEKKQQ